jgi:hypothetical protein
MALGEHDADFSPIHVPGVRDTAALDQIVARLFDAADCGEYRQAAGAGEQRLLRLNGARWRGAPEPFGSCFQS